MVLTPQLVDHAMKCVCKEAFVPSEEVIPQHILFQQYNEHYPNFPKVLFYIVMDNFFGFAKEKSTSGDLGRRLRFEISLVSEELKPRK